ncbi:MAG: hypothetical protein R6W76_23875, partial [Caldilinea sp.]
VAIARALSNDPAILVADEPTGNLDSRTAEAVFHLFENLVDGGKTILMVTHDEDMAKRVTRTVTIADGQIESDIGSRQDDHARLSHHAHSGALHLPPVPPIIGVRNGAGRLSEGVYA